MFIKSVNVARIASQQARLFSNTTRAQRDVAKVTLVGGLFKPVQMGTDKNGREYTMFNVVTSRVNAQKDETKTFHTVFNYRPLSPQQADFYKNLLPGTKVYVDGELVIRSEKVGDVYNNNYSVSANAVEIIKARTQQNSEGSESGFPYEEAKGSF